MSSKFKGSWTELGKAKLASSGLSVKMADDLGMYEVVSAAQLHPNFDPLPALVLPYYDIHGNEAVSHPKWPPFYRLRYLAKGNTFKDLTTDKSQRYAQPPHSGVCVYMPRTQDWEAISKDTGQGIIVTEGELKSVAACEAGYPTLGLGGVWNFMATREGVFFLPELEQFKWARRDVYICFDSDFHEKVNICQAIMRLAEELTERGAMVYVLILPDIVEDGKTGLDDYFLVSGSDEFDRLLEEAEPIGMARPLWRCNDEVIYVEDPGLIIVKSNGQKMAPSQFKEHSRWSTVSIAERSVDKEGNFVTKKVAVAPVWLRWPMRRSATRVTYAPGEPRITEDNEYNQWPGWGCEPAEGDVAPFLKLISFVFADADKGADHWFLDWAAYPIQNPGVKMFAAAVVHGVVQGTGKSLVGYTLGRIYGKNFKEITDEDLEGGWSDWAENKQFIMGDEISGNDNRQFANALKRLITQRTVSINIKFIPKYDVPDCINYYFTSQHPDAFFLEDTDRRFFINEVTADEPLPMSFYLDYVDWLYRRGGDAAIFDYLLKRKFVKNPGTGDVFNPAAPAFRTSAKERMTRTGKGEQAAWIRDLKEMPDQVLMFGQMRYARDLFTATELCNIYQTEHPNAKPPSPVGLGRALGSAGFPQVAGGLPLRGVDGKMGRYYAVRNVKHWKKVTDRKAMEKNIALSPIRGTK